MSFKHDSFSTQSINHNSNLQKRLRLYFELMEIIINYTSQYMILNIPTLIPFLTPLNNSLLGGHTSQYFSQPNTSKAQRFNHDSSLEKLSNYFFEFMVVIINYITSQLIYNVGLFLAWGVATIEQVHNTIQWHFCFFHLFTGIVIQ